MALKFQLRSHKCQSSLLKDTLVPVSLNGSPCNMSLQQRHCEWQILWCPFPFEQGAQVSSGWSQQSPCLWRTVPAAGERSTVVAGGSLSFAGSGGAAVTGCERACAGESYCPAGPAGRCRAVEATVAVPEPRTQEWRPWKMRPSGAAAANTVPARHPGPGRSAGRSCLLPPSWSWWWPCWTGVTACAGWEGLWWGSWGWFRPDCAVRSGWAAVWAAWVAGRCSSTRPPENPPPQTPRRWSPPSRRARRWALWKR